MDPANSPETPQPQSSSPQNPPAISIGKTQAANLCAVVVGVCFFLPWIQNIFLKLSGFEFQKLSDGGKVLWLMPIFCVITLYAGFVGKSQKIAGQLAGAAPFAILAYGLVNEGQKLIDVLAPGAWLGLVSGAALFLLVRR
ncbi:MAG: hypothetical protein ABMA26_08325 [Limisphaerales bacterium]